MGIGSGHCANFFLAAIIVNYTHFRFRSEVNYKYASSGVIGEVQLLVRIWKFFRRSAKKRWITTGVPDM
jgi:hypothetical protein